MKDAQGKRFRTRAVHGATRTDPTTGAHITPIYQTSTFAYGSFERGRRLFAGEESGFLYSRLGNPTVRAFEEAVADLEGAPDALAFTSGMSAIAALCLTVLSPGDHVAFVGPLYGGTEGLFRDTLERYGVDVTEVNDYRELEAAMRNTTRMVYVETPTNPTLRISDLAHIGRVANEHGALAVADNTFATPYLTKPLEYGFDVSLHSATKYLGGHGDALGGILTGPADLMEHVRLEGLRHVGGCMSPIEAHLFARGLKTLALRMDAHCEGALRLAHRLEGHPAVARIYYPGLPGHDGHDVATRQMRHYGGMIALELHGGERTAERFLDSLSLFAQAVSLGDVASLASHPASTTHALLDPETRERQGITGGLVRLSVGIEDPDDLLEDIALALEQSAEPVRG